MQTSGSITCVLTLTSAGQGRCKHHQDCKGYGEQREITPMPYKPVPPDEPATLDNIPQTGDNSNIMM